MKIINRSFSVFLSAAMTAAVLSTANVSGALAGDANGDGKFNVRDAAYIARMMAKGQTGQPYSAADYNRDGKVNVRDAAAIAKKIAAKTAATLPKAASFADFAGEYWTNNNFGKIDKLVLRSDGSFTGESGSSRVRFGEVYTNTFSGSFVGIKKINDYTYQATMTKLKYSYEPGTTKTIGGVRYIYDVADIDDRKTVYFYKKGAPTSKLPEDYISSITTITKMPDTLPFNGIDFSNWIGFMSK